MSFVVMHVSPVVSDIITSDKCAATHFSQKHSKTMDVICVRILLCISFSRYISLSAGLNIVTSTFRVSGKHHDKDRIRNCAMKVLQNTTLIGGRISDSTGHCEELTHSLDENQTSESEYGHVEKIIFIKTYQPAIPSGQAESFATMLPLPLSMGSKLEFSFDRTPPNIFQITFDECQNTCPTSGGERRIMFWISEHSNEFLFASTSKKDEPVSFEWETFCPLSKCKLTIVIHDWGIKVLANGKKITDIASVEMSTMLQEMKRVTINIGNGLKLNRVEVQR